MNAHEIINMVQTWVDAEEEMDMIASRILATTGCETCYEVSEKVNRGQWLQIPRYPVITGYTSISAYKKHGNMQHGYKNSLNRALEALVDAQNKLDHVKEKMQQWVRNELPDTSTELYIYIVYNDVLYKLGYRRSNNTRVLVFEEAHELATHEGSTYSAIN